jgi:hypothetical protein
MGMIIAIKRYGSAVGLLLLQCSRPGPMQNLNLGILMNFKQFALVLLTACGLALPAQAAPVLPAVNQINVGLLTAVTSPAGPNAGYFDIVDVGQRDVLVFTVAAGLPNVTFNVAGVMYNGEPAYALSYALVLDGATPAGYGNLSLAMDINSNFSGAQVFNLVVGNTYNLYLNWGVSDIGAAYVPTLTPLPDSGNVPEPGVLLLLGLGALAFAVTRSSSERRVVR